MARSPSPQACAPSGGAAVAAKSGLLKFLGKFIWVGLAAVAVAAKRLFKRRA